MDSNSDEEFMQIGGGMFDFLKKSKVEETKKLQEFLNKMKEIIHIINKSNEKTDPINFNDKQKKVLDKLLSVCISLIKKKIGEPKDVKLPPLPPPSPPSSRSPTSAPARLASVPPAASPRASDEPVDVENNPATTKGEEEGLGRVASLFGWRSGGAVTANKSKKKKSLISYFTGKKRKKGGEKKLSTKKICKNKRTSNKTKKI